MLKNCSKKEFVLRIVLLASVLASTTSLPASANTAILPTGVRAFAYKHIEATVLSSFDKQGIESDFSIKERLGASVIRSISVDAAAAYDQLSKIDSQLATGIDLGNINIDPKISVSANIFGLAWGLTNNLMIVGAVPVMKGSVTLAGGYQNSGAISNASKQLKSISDSRAATATAMAQILDQLPTIRGEYLQGALVNDLGYKPIGNWSASGIGDTQSYLQARFINDDFYRNGAKLGVFFPTGKADDPDNLVSIPFGDGFYSTYIESLQDFNLWKESLFASLLGRYQYQWAAMRTYRLRTADIALTSRKESIHYKPGNYWKLGAELSGKLYKSIGASAAYSLKQKARDHIQGADPSYDYSILERKTEKTVREAEFSVSYSTVNLFERKKFPIPLKLGATFTRVVSGVNTERVNQSSLDFEMYF